MLNLLLPLDGSELSECSLAHAVAIVRSIPSKVTLLRVVTPAEFRAKESFSRVDWRLYRHQARTYLETVAEIFAPYNAACETRIEEGRPAESIISVANDMKTPLLIMSTHGRGAATEFPRGGVAGKVLSTLDASVLLIDAGKSTSVDKAAEYNNILAVIDGSPQSECTLRVATTFAESLNVALQVVCVANTTEVPSILKGNSMAQTLCHDVSRMTQRAAERRLSDLKATHPASLELRTAVLVASSHIRPLPEAARRYDPDLIMAGIGILNGTNEPLSRASATVGRAPLMILSPKGIGTAICEAGARDDKHVASRDVS